MTNQQTAFLNFMEGYADFIEELSKQEEKKYKALISYDHQQVDHMLADQQAALMKIETMEKQRENFQQEAGFKDMTFKEILTQLEPADRENFQQLFQRVEIAVMDIRFINSKALSFAKLNLKELGTVIPPEAQGISTSYSPMKKKVQKENIQIFETKI